MTDEDVMRVQHQGLLYRYVPDSFFKRAHWKETWTVLYANNAMLYLHKDDSVQSKIATTLDLKPIVLWIAFGQDALKFCTSAPKWPQQDEPLNKSLTDNLIAIPKDKNASDVTWLAAKDRSTLREWIWHFAKCLKLHSNAPMLSSKRGDEDRLKQEVAREFDLIGNEDEWEIYWLHNLWNAEKKFTDDGGDLRNSAANADKAGILHKVQPNLTDFKGGNLDPRSMAEKVFHPPTTDQFDNKFRSGNQSGQTISYYFTQLDNGLKKTEIVIDVTDYHNLRSTTFSGKSQEDEVYIGLLRKYKSNLLDSKNDGNFPMRHKTEKISQF